MGTLTSTDGKPRVSLEELIAKAVDPLTLSQLDAELEERIRENDPKRLRALRERVNKRLLEVSEEGLIDESALQLELAEVGVMLEQSYGRMVEAIEVVSDEADQVRTLRAAYDKLWNRARNAGLEVPVKPAPLDQQAARNYPLKALLRRFQTAALDTRL